MVRHRSQSAAGPSQRQLRVAEVLRRRLSEVLMRGEVHDPDLAGVAITVGEVRASPDLRQATAYVMPLGGANREQVLAALQRHRGHIRRLVSRDLALKFSPELRFALDLSFDRLDETRRLFAQETVRRDVDAGDASGGRDGADDREDR